MKNKKATKTILAAIFLFISIFLTPISALGDSLDVTVSVNSPDIVEIGNNFNVTINISYVEGFDAANFDVTYNPEIINITQVSGGKINNTNLPCTWGFTGYGKILVIINLPGLTGVTGEGYLAKIQFETISTGTSNINLSNGVLANNTVKEIPAEWNNNTVEIQSEEELFYLTTAVFGNGLIILSPIGPYNFGQLVNIEAIPDTYFEFSHWSGNLTGSSNQTSIIMDSNKTVNAHFTAIQYTLTINIIGNGSTDPSEGVHVFLAGSEVLLNATANENWFFSGWSGDISSNQNPISILMDSNKTINANFTEDVPVEYNLIINKTGNGTVNPIPGTYSYNQGTEVQLEAIPDPGWVFSHWEGNISGTNNQTTIIMDENKTATAIFEEYTPEPKVSIKLSNIHLFKIKIDFQNTGEINISNMNWSLKMNTITSNRINFSDNGSIDSLTIDEEKTISTEKISNGIGFIRLKIQSSVDKYSFDKEFNGFKIGPIVLLLI